MVRTVNGLFLDNLRRNPDFLFEYTNRMLRGADRIYFSRERLINEFLKLGGSIDRQAQEDGNTLLLNALEGTNSRMALFLIAKGANIYLKNNQGHDALFLARRENLHAVEGAIKDLLWRTRLPYLQLVDGCDAGGHIARHLMQEANLRDICELFVPDM